MKLKEVIDKSTEKEFLQLPVRLYKEEKNWIRPLDSDIQAVFDPDQNKHFRHGEAIRWLLVDEKNNTIGRIASFFDKKIATSFEQPTGAIGFFECINNREAAFMLFDRAKTWLEAKGMEAMDGPVNFGDRDKWWGLLVDGFYEPNYCMPYNFAYYQSFFESYGFKNYFNQYTYHRNVSDSGLADRIEQTAERIAKNPDYRVSHINKKELDKYAYEFRHVYNKAWTRYSGVKEITVTHAKALLNSLKPILDERLIWFTYYKDEPVAFLIMVPEMNQIFKHVNGSLNLWGKIKVFYHLKIKKSCKKALGLIFGIAEEHQRKGLEGAMIWKFRETALTTSFPYRELELNWIGDFNPTMMRIAEMIGFSIRKTHITYRFLFDREKEFKRAKRVS